MNINPVDYKQQTTKTYDALAVELVKGFERYFESVARAEADHFLALVGRSTTILDLGCGGGQTSAYFVSQGHTALGADLSQEMLKACRRRGLDRLVRLDLEALPFRRRSLDAIWAHTSLIHIPKERLADAMAALGQRLNPNGVLFVALREGEGEGYLGEPGVERWFSSFRRGEFEGYIPPALDIVRSSRTQIRSTAFLNYHLVKE